MCKMTSGKQLAVAGDRRLMTEDRAQRAEDRSGALCRSLPASDLRPPTSGLRPPIPQVALLTAGRDRPYALGLAAALAAAGAQFDFIGSDEVDSPELHTSPQIHFLNLRGDQSVEAGRLK